MPTSEQVVARFKAATGDTWDVRIREVKTEYVIEMMTEYIRLLKGQGHNVRVWPLGASAYEIKGTSKPMPGASDGRDIHIQFDQRGPSDLLVKQMHGYPGASEDIDSQTIDLKNLTPGAVANILIHSRIWR